MNLNHRPLAQRISARQEPGRIPAYSSGLAGLLSMLLPGLGQFYVREYRRGLVMIGISLGLFAAGLLFLREGPIAILSFLVRPRFLALVFVANLLLFAFRFVAVKDAVRYAGERSSRRNLTLALLLALTAAPHLAVGYYDIVTIDALDEIFSDDAKDQNRAQTTDEEYKLTLPVSPNANVTVIPAAAN